MSLRAVVASVSMALVGLGLAALGAWGYRSAESLSPAALDADERAHRGRVLRMGAAGCVLAGVVLMSGVVVGLARQ